VTISKIRFLESQGLIDPERTPSGYRKFYDDDVELLRCILREQRENYLPLRVIKDRLDSGEIDPTSETPRPRGIKNMPDDEAHDASAPSNGAADRGTVADVPRGADVLFARTDPPPSDADVSSPVPLTPSLVPEPVEVAASTDDHRTDATNAEAPGNPPSGGPTASQSPARAPTSLLPGVLLSKSELCSMASISPEALDSLESYGVVTGVRGSGGLYGEDALEVASIAKQFLEAGFDARHLRGWKVAVDREAGLFEQMIQPLVRQRNPHAKAQAREQLTEMAELGSQLRTALMHAAMRQHYED
jgi:DNA-binding transcriptional MerR regulator